MACHPLSPLLSGPAPLPAPDWEPALTQLRRLSRAQLQRLVSLWLRRSGMALVERIHPGPATLAVRSQHDQVPVPLTIQVRVYQRRTRLHAHHVEAFFGRLVRTGTPAGILITTGEFTPDAVALARSLTAPGLRLYSGEEWSAELASRRVGLRRRQLWRWVVDFARSRKWLDRERELPGRGAASRSISATGGVR